MTARLTAETRLARQYWKADSARGRVIRAEVDGAELVIRWHDPVYPATRPVARVTFERLFHRLNRDANGRLQ